MSIIERVSPNRALSGNFAPVTEEVTAVDLEVIGAIPSELEGRLLRIGPNPLEAPDPDRYHWFVGTGMVHGVRLRDGRAEWYRNRWVRTTEVARALGETAPGGPTHGGMEGANTNVIGHAGRTWAVVEAGANPVELTYDLGTIGNNNFDGSYEGGFTAHPKVDPVTGELHAMAYHWGWGNVAKYIVVDADAKVRRVVPVELTGGSMMHDVGLSASRVVIMDQPCVFDIDLISQGAAFPYRWDQDYPCRYGLMAREGSTDVQWFDVDPCYVFHPLNTYDLPDGRTVMDAVRHPRMFDSRRLMPDEGIPTLWRWTFDPASGRATSEQLSDIGEEFPRHDERLVGLRNRYGYAAQIGAHFAHGAVLKHDLDRGTVESHDFGPGRGSLETVFVPRSGGTDEDDGYLMSYVYDANTDTSDVVILAAQDLAGDPVATVKLPVRVPYGFHGNWVPDSR